MWIYSMHNVKCVCVCAGACMYEEFCQDATTEVGLLKMHKYVLIDQF